MPHTQTTARQSLPTPPCWADLSTVDRNTLIGNLIGLDAIRHTYLARDGAYLWACQIPVEEAAERNQWLAGQQKTETLWKRFRRNYDKRITAEDRGKITIEIEVYHLRYSDTPGGGWKVIEAIRPHVENIFVMSCDDGQWEVMAIPLGGGDDDVTCKAPTMQEAACELALLILPNA